MSEFATGGFMPDDDYESYSPKLQAKICKVIAKILEERARDLRRELDAELRLTHHFWYNEINFKLYLN